MFSSRETNYGFLEEDRLILQECGDITLWVSDCEELVGVTHRRWWGWGESIWGIGGKIKDMVLDRLPSLMHRKLEKKKEEVLRI